VWIVQLALRRPYTFIVIALALLLATPLTLRRMSTDIFPDVDIPVVSVVWTYSGLSAQEMGQRIAAVNERSLTNTVNDIEHIESQALAGVAVVKVFFQPDANIQTALAQVVAIEQNQLRQLPAGVMPPLILKYTASSVPVIQLGLSSPSLSEQALFDLAGTLLRPRLITIPGASIPSPYGGKVRLVSVDLDADALLAKGLTPLDIVNAVTAQNLVLPSGTVKVDGIEYGVKFDGSPASIEGLNELPVRASERGTVLLREVAHVRDGFAPQTNIARRDGRRGVLLPILKNGGASTLQIVDDLRALLPKLMSSLPPDLNISPLFDQSVFVRAAAHGVMEEAGIAALLTAVMILLFLGSWRSTAIVALSIPLSIMAAVVGLHVFGQTLNLMTLGGLALAVGLLVDDATVTIENIERHRHRGEPLREAILQGAGEIAGAAFVSTLSICIVFVPMFFLGGVAQYLFAPLAEAVMLAMAASYVLSRTLVPTLAMLWGRADGASAPRDSLLARVHRPFDARLAWVRTGYALVLSTLLPRRAAFAAGFFCVCALSLGLIPLLGQDFFPAVDAGQILLHLRAPTGTRIEETARIADQVESVVREVVPPVELDTIVDNLGLPYSGINMAYSNSGTLGTLDGEIQVSLRPGHGATAGYMESLRMLLPKRFPGVEFFFQPADIVTQTLNFGVPAAIDVQFTGADLVASHRLASALAKDLRGVPGAVDVRVHQRMDQPVWRLDMDRVRLQQMGMTANGLAQNLLVSLSGSFQTTPAYWLNPGNGVVYNLAIQTPQYQVASLDAILRTPVSAPGAAPGQLVRNFVRARRETEPTVMSRYNTTPAIDVYANVAGRDLAAVARDVQVRMDAIAPRLPRGTHVTLRGQVRTLEESFSGLAQGLAVAVVLVYLLIVVTFQSWLDALVVVLALPPALAGIAWALFLTGTSLSVPALIGAIMTMGMGTANAILVVSFARQRLDEGAGPLRAALEAATARMRPVLMTAFAMIIGMVPMALGLGVGGEQNAPLGRTAIGGLLWATAATLFLVPVLFAIVHRARPAAQAAGFLDARPA